MKDRLNFEDYKDKLDKKDYEKAYQEIANKSIELAVKIAKIKNINIDKREDLKSTLYNIKFTFKKESATFRDVIYLMKELIEWDCEQLSMVILEDDEEIVLDDPDDTPEKRIERYIKIYNRILIELEQYQNVEKEIKKSGYQNLLKERNEKLIKIFQEMLDFKSKKYEENWDLKQYAEKINQYYNSYSDELWNAVSAANMASIQYDIEEDSIPINEVESIMFLDDFYEILIDEDYGYKYYANFYRDFELQEGQTFSDLFDLEVKKFIKLFKDMLDFLNVEYDREENSLDKLKLKVMEKYPYYTAMLFHLISPNPNTTYIQNLNSMEDVYEKISSEYKNHEENLIKYKDYMELLKKEGYLQE